MVYQGIKKAIGPMHSKTSKSATAEVISDKTGIQADRKMGGPLHVF